jgi:aryl-alcohol dehydrogenase-like predicted oxidoreductase
MQASVTAVPAHTRVLGGSGLVASRLGLGLAALGRPGYMTLHHQRDLEGQYERSVMERRAHAVLDAAYAAGFRYFDAARSYGEAEAFLASWLSARALPPDIVTVASKWGYTYTAGWRPDASRHEVKDHSIGTLRRQLVESWDRLGPRLSLYQIHSVTAYSGVLGDPAVIDTLARLRAIGVRIGLTASGARQADVIRRALEVERDGTRVFDVVQATWNLLERGAEAALAEAHQEGMGVVIKEALANGRLVGSSMESGFAPRIERLREAANRLGAPVDAVAIAAVLARPWADVVLSGAATVAHLQSNLAALALEWTPWVEEFLEPLTMPSTEYWNVRRGFAWN